MAYSLSPSTRILKKTADGGILRIFVLRDSIFVRASIERCFALSTSVDVVACDLRMRPIGGRTRGLVQAGDLISWRGWQLGLPQFHVSCIPPEAFHAPVHFRDKMVAGRFRYFEHDHFFESHEDGVWLRDEVRFALPFGLAGSLVGAWVLSPHIRGLMRRRFQRLKRLAEGSGWQTFLSD